MGGHIYQFINRKMFERQQTSSCRCIAFSCSSRCFFSCSCCIRSWLSISACHTANRRIIIRHVMLISLASGCARQHILNGSSSPKIGMVATGRASSIKNTLGCLAGLTLTLACVAAAGLLVVIQWEEWLREDQQLIKGLIKSRIRRA